MQSLDKANAWQGKIVAVQEVTCTCCLVQDHYAGTKVDAERFFRDLGWMRRRNGDWYSPNCRPEEVKSK